MSTGASDTPVNIGMCAAAYRTEVDATQS